MKDSRPIIALSFAVVAGLLGVLPAPRALAACAYSATTQFRSNATGTWSDAASWQCSDDGVTWQTATVAPTNVHGMITIRNPHTVTVEGNLTVDQVIVDSGGQVTVASGVAWTLGDGAGTDLAINGTFLNQGGAWTANGTWTVNAGGTYIHNTGASIASPLGKAALDAASSFVYRGDASVIPAVSMSGRTYGNLSFESTSGSWSSLALTGGNATIVQGDFVLGSGVTFNNNTLVGLTIAGNWTNSGTFLAGSGTVIFSGGSGFQTIGGAADTTFAGLTIDNGDLLAGVSLGRNVTVNRLLTLNAGRLYVGGFNLTLGPNASISGAASPASMVVTDTDGTPTGDGFLCKVYADNGSFTFPVGDDNALAQYSPSTLAFSSGLDGNSTVCVRTTNERHPSWPGAGYPTYITRYWSATSSDSTFTANASFTYDQADVVVGGGQSEATLYHKIWNGSTWATGNQTDASTHTFATDVSSFSDHTAFSRSPLGIVLADFGAIQQGDAVLLTWETVTELDNRGFNLYRGTSAAGPDRQLNATLIPSQSPGSPGGFVYTWEDQADLVPGTTYFYWVEDVDVYGATTIHGPVSVDFAGPAAVTLVGLRARLVAGLPVSPAWTLLALLVPLAGALAVRRRRG